MSFSLVYGAKAMVPIEVTTPSARLALANKSSDSHGGISDIEAFDEEAQCEE